MSYVVIDSIKADCDYPEEWDQARTFASQEEAISYAKEMAAKYAPHHFDVAQVILRVQCPVGDPTVRRIV